MNRETLSLTKAAVERARRDHERRQAALEAVRHLRRVDPRLGEIIRKIGPHRPIITPDPFVTLVGAIVQQQVSMSAAAAIQKRLKALCPRGRTTPTAIARLQTDALRKAGLSRQKVRYVRDLAGHFTARRLTPRKLREATDEEVIAATTQVKGVGRWTAEMLLIFCLERPDVWPTDDLGLRKAVRQFLGDADMPTNDVMELVGESWRPYRTYASWYLWRSLEGPFMPGMAL
ncbi:MAG: DNA-3-methyladenine glycosylase [Planctomycetes bacterium]|nr:DNA-3-methyladenine glycosylase [Planctomycetota bacterium]